MRDGILLRGVLDSGIAVGDSVGYTCGGALYDTLLSVYHLDSGGDHMSYLLLGWGRQLLDAAREILACICGESVDMRLYHYSPHNG